MGKDWPSKSLPSTRAGKSQLTRPPYFQSYSQAFPSVKPDFDSALNAHFAAIANRDIEAFKSHLTQGDALYTVVQNGHAFTTPAETIAKIHTDTTAILRRPDIVERHASLGTTIWTMSPEEATRFMGAEVAKWEETALGIGIERGTLAQ